MPIHDWIRVDAGLFHHLHQGWVVRIADALNAGRLPPGFTALTDQVTGRTEPLAVADAPPKARFIEQLDEEDIYTRKANRVKITHRHGRVVAVIEVVSPGNKSSENGMWDFLRKTTDLLGQGIYLMVVDLFPRTPRDPHGIHREIWGELTTSTFEPPADKPLTAVAYQARPVKRAYIEPLAVGDDLPDLPLFLSDDEVYVPAPLESAYRASWAAFPADYRELIEPAPPGGGTVTA